MARVAALAALVLPVLSCQLGSRAETGPAVAAPAGPDAIDDAQLRDAAATTDGWLSYGGSYSEQRYSRLARIDATNVAGLGLAWSFDMATNRGLEATPIVVGGVIYTTGTWSVVVAIDARSGRQL